jgi:hypothetical protein
LSIISLKLNSFAAKINLVMGLTGASISAFLGRITLAISDSIFSTISTRRFRFPNQHLPSTAENLVETFDLNTLRNNLLETKRVLITGRRGSGKTTIATRLHKLLDGENTSRRQQRIPVFIPASQLNLSSESPVATVANLVSRSPKKRRFQHLARRLIDEEQLVFIVDDLDYLDSFKIARFESFINECKNHIFICIACETPKSNSSFWVTFPEVKVSNWNRANAVAYIDKRVTSSEDRGFLLQHLEELQVFDKNYSALEWRCVLDAFTEFRIFSLFHPRNLETPVSYNLLLTYFRIVTQSHSFQWDQFIKDVGSTALKLLKRSKTGFRINDFPHLAPYNERLGSKLFKTTGDYIEFNAEYQAFLAGAYLGLHWTEAKRELLDESAGVLVWTAVFNCADKFCPQEHSGELFREFERLAKPISEKTLSPYHRTSRKQKFNRSRGELPLNKGPGTSELLRACVRGTLAKAGIDDRHGMLKLGELTLSCCLENRDFFSEDEAVEIFSEPIWRSLINQAELTPPEQTASQDRVKGNAYQLFYKLNDNYFFVDNLVIAVLSGYLLAESWPGVKKLLSTYLPYEPSLREAAFSSLLYVCPDDMEDMNSFWVSNNILNPKEVSALVGRINSLPNSRVFNRAQIQESGNVNICKSELGFGLARSTDTTTVRIGSTWVNGFVNRERLRLISKLQNDEIPSFEREKLNGLSNNFLHLLSENSALDTSYVDRGIEMIEEESRDAVWYATAEKEWWDLLEKQINGTLSTEGANRLDELQAIRNERILAAHPFDTTLVDQAMAELQLGT